ncbi:MAG: transposase [Bradyrhizobium sp.]|nr:transposase [Bradyrhizobium sp.]
MEYPPKHTSSRLLRKERRDVARRYWRATLRSPSYFAASTRGATLAVIRQYVEQQRVAPLGVNGGPGRRISMNSGNSC